MSAIDPMKLADERAALRATGDIIRELGDCGFEEAIELIDRLTKQRDLAESELAARALPRGKGLLAGLPKPETMLAYASILEKKQYHIDTKTGLKFALPTGEVVEAACAALRHCAAVRPLVTAGREELESTIARAIKDFYPAWEPKPDFARAIALAVAPPVPEKDKLA